MNKAERRAVWHYRLRGYRILGTNVWAGGNEVDVIARRGRRLVFCEVKGKGGARLRRPARDDRAREGTPRAPRRRGLARGSPRPHRARGALRRRRRACRTAGAGRRRVLARNRSRAVEPRQGRGPDAGCPLCRDRPRALVVRARAPRARPHEARAPAPPVPRQVRAAARRGAARTPRAPGRARARPLRGLGDDARAGPRVGARRGRRRRRRLQLPPDAGQDGRVQPLRARARHAGRALTQRRAGQAVRLRARLV